MSSEQSYDLQRLMVSAFGVVDHCQDTQPAPSIPAASKLPPEKQNGGEGLRIEQQGACLESPVLR